MIRFGFYFATPLRWRWNAEWRYDGIHYANEWAFGPIAFVKYIPHTELDDHNLDERPKTPRPPRTRSGKENR